MKIIKLLGLGLLFFVPGIYGQYCNCKESYQWLVNTISENDAGFQIVVDKKGVEDYKKHEAHYALKTDTISDVKACQVLLLEWLHYFRSGHINISVNSDNSVMSASNKSITNEEIRLLYKNEPQVNITQKELIGLLEQKKNRNPIEGIWQYGNYSVGILEDEKVKSKFNAFIIQADSIYWVPKQLKAIFYQAEDQISYTTDFYMLNHSKANHKARFLNSEKSVLEIGSMYWTRSYPEHTFSRIDEVNLNFSKSHEPFVEQLSDNTVYLRIPSFEIQQKKNIENILEKYNQLISSTSNLIIDIRYGTGGAGASFENLIPLFYTTPIRHVGVEFYSTELNAKAFDNYAKQFEDTARINGCIRIANRMRDNVGKFIPLWNLPYAIDSSHIKTPFPQKIGILCNKFNGSTDEQFLLTAKQSWKVKVFGKPTGGMLDISNINTVNSPDGKFSLRYGMSRSKRIPDFCIDEVGIQPDFFIDDAIHEYDWIEYVKTKLEE